jgi:hypothetical protein
MKNIKESLEKLKFYGKSFNDLTPDETMLLLNDLMLVSIIESIRRDEEGDHWLMGELLVTRYEMLKDILSLQDKSDRYVTKVVEMGNYSFNDFVNNYRTLNDQGQLDFLSELLEGSKEVSETVMVMESNMVFQLPLN